MKKANIKKITSIIITITTLFTFMTTITVGAATHQESGVKAKSDTTFVSANNARIINNDTLYNNYKDLCDRIAESLYNVQDEIYVGDLEFQVAQLPYIIRTALRTHPELFYVNSKQFAVASDDSGIVAIVPFYLSSKEEIEVQRKKFDARVNEILSLVNDDMSDFKKALIIHDEIALNCTYCDDDKTGIRNVSAYNALIDCKANCQGYSGAYAYLLKLAGITTELVESSAMNHVWNNVCIDGEFYNVDLTWDDPVPNKDGHVDHKYFLLSDAAFTTKSEDMDTHIGFDYELCPCTSTKYDKAYFHSIDTRYCYIGTDCYAICNKYGNDYQNCLIKYDPETTNIEVVENFTHRWRSGPTSYWKNGYMSLEVHDGVLYFNGPDGIYAYNPETKEITPIYDESGISVAAATGNDYYGLVIKGNEIYVATADSPKSELSLTLAGNCLEKVVNIAVGVKRNVTLGNKTKTDILYGDIDRDGDVKITDATLIQKYTAELETFNEAQSISADVNGDGVINVVDSTEIQKYIVI